MESSLTNRTKVWDQLTTKGDRNHAWIQADEYIYFVHAVYWEADINIQSIVWLRHSFFFFPSLLHFHQTISTARVKLVPKLKQLCCILTAKELALGLEKRFQSNNNYYPVQEKEGLEAKLWPRQNPTKTLLCKQLNLYSKTNEKYINHFYF